MSDESTAPEPEFDEDRQLCPDGACLGVVVDGKCNVCGLTADGTPAASVPAAADADAATAGADEAFDDERQLCPDGACIGVIGPDGRCKTCGRPAESAAAPA